MSRLVLAPAVSEAIAAGSPVVALESAVITHGLPNAAAMDAVRRQRQACVNAGTTPAVVAVFVGALKIGLSLDECAALAERPDAVKV